MSDATLRILGTSIAVGGFLAGFFIIVYLRMRVGDNKYAPKSLARLGFLARGLASFARATQRWRRDPSQKRLCRQAMGASPALVVSAIVVTSVAAGMVLLHQLGLTDQSAGKGRAFWNPIAVLSGFLSVALSPAVLAALLTSFFVSRGYRQGPGQGIDADPRALHSALLVPAMWCGIAVAALSMAAQALTELLWPSIRWGVNHLNLLGRLEALAFRLAAFALILVTAIHRTSGTKFFNRVVQIYFTWWAARIALAFTLSFAAAGFGWISSAELRRWIVTHSPAFLWIAVYVTAFAAAWLRSRDLAERQLAPSASTVTAPPSK